MQAVYVYPFLSLKRLIFSCLLFAGTACTDNAGKPKSTVDGWAGYAEQGKGFVAFRNLVVNSGMEQDRPGGRPQGWLCYANGGGNNSTFSVTVDEAHSGDYSLDVQVKSADGREYWNIGVGPPAIPVVPNTSYHYSAWVKGSVGAKVSVNVTLPQEPWTIFNSSNVVTLSGEWEEVAFDVIVGDTPSVLANMLLNFKENTGKKILIDDVRFVLNTD